MALALTQTRLRVTIFIVGTIELLILVIFYKVCNCHPKYGIQQSMGTWQRD